MNNPVIKLNGKEYIAPNPKVALWKEVMKVRENLGGTSDGEAYEGMMKIIVDAFKNPKVTAEALERDLELEEFTPLFWEVCRWINSLVMGKAEEIPNEMEPVENQE